MTGARVPLADQDAAGWMVGRDGFDPGRMGHRETVFTIGNGNLSLRGTFEEGHPQETAGSFMHRVWDDLDVHATELANLPRWWGLDLWLDDRRVRYEDAAGGRRTLDLRTGLLRRAFDWPVAAGADLKVRHERFISLVEPYGAMLRTTVELTAGVADLRVRVGASVHVENTGRLHWRLVGQSAGEDGVTLVAVTRGTGIPIGVVVRPRLSASADLTPGDADGQPALDYRLTLRAGEPVEIIRSVGIVPAIDTAVPLNAAREVSDRLDTMGWSAALTASSEAWAQVWADCDVEIDGDPEAQLSVRYNLFQLNAAAPRFTEDASIGAKTLSGYGYRHHVFWDTESFMLPVFTFTQPDVARNMLAYRCRRLAGARAKAAAAGRSGAQFPWESAGTGAEVTPPWIEAAAGSGARMRVWSGDLEVHITADIALAVVQYWTVTGDDAFVRDQGAEVILDGARFWASLARADADGSFHLRDVVGPDEYHEHVDDNAYTNLLAAWHLRTADRVLAWLERTAPERAGRLSADLGIGPEERRRWAQVADHLAPPRIRDRVLEQFAGYFDRDDVDAARLRNPARQLSMQVLLGAEGVQRTQTVKQPDVLMLAFQLPDLFDAESLAANYHYYDPRTDHEQGSSLGPAVSSVIAARAGDPAAAYAQFLRAARADLDDVRGNASDGIHGASAGGLWQAVVLGFAGLRITDDGWTVEPRLPATWQRLRFAFRLRGVRQIVELRNDH
ncbi:glycosyl hydrolase family 65 protein [Propionicimonas sp.]|uniref:glycosyl hydrolase family 65 protein n=1 Tax=Propionicimonas sp. TaxID=1955623 RepID=UPI0039E2B7DF